MIDDVEARRQARPATGYHERVLDHLPAPVLVLDAAANVRYANPALLRLTGWTADDVLGTNIVDHVHPDDVAWVVDAYARVTDASTPNRDGEAPPGLRLRILGRDGELISIEAYGGGGLDDPAVGGSVYLVRHAVEDSLLDEIFAGIGGGASLDEIVADIVDLVVAPPLRMEAAVFTQRADGTAALVAASDDDLAAVPVLPSDGVPWSTLVGAPSHTAVADLPVDVREHLERAGFHDCFHAGAHAPDVEATLRIVAATRDPHRVWTPVLQRIERARELMSVVLLKRHNDLMLADAATRDSLTGLPNRAGLRRRFESAGDAVVGSALMFVDLDGFKEINDRHGHAVGDLVVSATAGRLRRAVRIDDEVARIGGDEFAVLIMEPGTRLDDIVIRRLADRVVGMLSEPVSVGDRSGDRLDPRDDRPDGDGARLDRRGGERTNGHAVSITASVGVARVGVGQSLDDALRGADTAMYDAKRAGGNRYRNAPVVD